MQTIKVLLVEDNPGDAFLIQEVLADVSSVTFELTLVERLSSALEQLDSASFDVILLDLLLPDSQGLDTFVRLHQHVALIPIVVLTGLNDETLAIQAMQSGAQDYLVKGLVSGGELLMRTIRYSIERKRAQADLYRREQEFRTLTENAPDIIARFDQNYRHLYINRAIEPITGRSAQDFIGKSNRELGIPEVQIEQWEQALENVFSTKEQTSLEFEFPAVSGTKFFQSRCVPEFSLDGSVESVLAITRDVTEQKLIEAQFLRAQRLESLGTLASGIAHDLNNILTPILSIAQVLPIQNPDLNAHSKQMLTILEHNARRGAGLVKQILTFARGWDGQRIPVQLKDVFDELEQIVRSTFPKSIEFIRADSDKDLWLVSADSNQLHQVFLNLLVNARDAMPNGGKLTLTAENFTCDQQFTLQHLEAKMGPYVVVTIRDRGTGIPAKILERIFEPFFTTKEVGKGTGLGLSTALGIIKSYDGFIEVHSQTIARSGSEFKIFIPAIRVPVKSAEPQPKLSAGNGELILIVDDEPGILEILKSILENYQYRVLTANNGIDAIACFRQHSQEIALTLIDMMMPEMAGLTTIWSLRSINPLAKIVVMSGLEPNSGDSENLEVSGFLAKPFSNAELLQALHHCLARV